MNLWISNENVKLSSFGDTISVSLFYTMLTSSKDFKYGEGSKITLFYIVLTEPIRPFSTKLLVLIS